MTTRPRLRVIYISGYTDAVVIEPGTFDSAVHFLAKPFTTGALTRTIRDVLDGAG